MCQHYAIHIVSNLVLTRGLKEDVPSSMLHIGKVGLSNSLKATRAQE